VGLTSILVYIVLRIAIVEVQYGEYYDSIES
jgi:hypothetical protein